MNKNSPQTSRGAAKAAKAGSRTAKKSAKPVAKAAARRTAKTVARKTSATPASKPMAKPIAPPIHPVSAPVAPLRTFSPPSPPTFAVADVPNSRHRYQVGQAVYYTSPSFGRAAASGSYTVVKLLPSDGDDCQYRIKSTGEAFERVAKESQLEQI